MSRIRSIKPDFWTDEKVVELTPFARLLFIGLWNFADDEGRMVYSPKKIKMQIFPADSVDISELIGEIRRESMVTIYTVDGIEYLQLNNFGKHQKIDKRSASKLPVPPSSTEFPPNSPESQLRKGREGIKEGNGRELFAPATAGVPKPPASACPHEQIIELYHEALPTARRVIPKLWNGARAKHLQARWREDQERQSLAWWKTWFEHIAKSDFLTGRTPPQQGRAPFEADLEWIVNPSNWAKIYEGKYHG